jgi:2-keto-4-pentenoate hydratase/2-oxohepta-3-ene-1,7-dioic acid hydratase in catechol pathway
MDIKQALDACAAVTLGKDMTLRDYAQGIEYLFFSSSYCLIV